MGKLNPGGVVVVFATAGQGISPLACLPTEIDRMEESIADEEIDMEENVQHTREGE